MSALNVRLPHSLHKKVKELAAREGISMNQFVAMAVAEKMSALMTEEDYLKQRALRGERAKYEDILTQVPDVEPEERDRL